MKRLLFRKNSIPEEKDQIIYPSRMMKMHFVSVCYAIRNALSTMLFLRQLEDTLQLNPSQGQKAEMQKAWLESEKAPFRKKEAGSFGYAIETSGRKWIGFSE
jgi:hypothetical protein